ncbi:uncharacterized protein G2W53_025374 [Senna tora]|uniref:Uncharacterized protein n=1 Tax=Senna tora TaxID=362788 RepID=A0A834WK75_9FABA|nr:uncharacterized protein G2W53_025374 [Senna tora]
MGVSSLYSFLMLLLLIASNRVFMQSTEASSADMKVMRKLGRLPGQPPSPRGSPERSPIHHS